MTKKKRVNPRRIPQTAQQRNTEIKHAAVDIAMAIIFNRFWIAALSSRRS